MTTKLRTNEEQLRTAKQEALTFELAWNAEGGKIEQLQAKVAMRDEAIRKVAYGLHSTPLHQLCEGVSLIGGASNEVNVTLDDGTVVSTTATTSHWLEKKLLEARIDEQERWWAHPIIGLRLEELRAQLAALEGEKE